MKFFEVLARLIFEFIVDLLLFVIEHRRNKKSFDRREKAYQPIRGFLNKVFSRDLKAREFKEKGPEKHSMAHKTVTLALAILAILWIRHSVIEPYKIPSGSMIPTLKIGDHIFVNKLAYGLRIPFMDEVWTWGDPKRGEVFIFVPPENPDVVYVKRVIGVPGDTIRVEDDKLYINGKYIDRVEEPFFPAMDDVEEEYTEDNHKLFIEDLLGTKHYALFEKERYLHGLSRSLEVVVPEKSYFAMGDNRDHSHDSRYWGFVKRDAVRGRALFVWLSINWSKMFTPQWLRFSRIGKSIH